jgi:UDP-glucose 4-epimerase
MNAFVSGGAGFIGSHLIRHLLADNDISNVMVFDNFSSGQQSFLPDADQSRLRVVRGDLKKLEAVKEAMDGCDTVFHLAANPDIAKAARFPDIDFWEGTYLTQNVLEAMRATGAKSIIYTSGSGVYGENSSTAFREDYGPCIPISTYGASKLAGEALVSAYCHLFDINGLAFRFANVVGARQTHGVGYDFVNRLRQDPRRLRILGDGKQSKSYIHVDDVLSAMFTAKTAFTATFDIYNVATDDYMTVNEIADITVEESGLQRSKVVYEYTGGDRGWKGDVPVVRFDVSKIKSLGWKAQRSSSRAVRDAIRAMIREPLP